MFDIITIGTATRDVFVKSKDFHVDSDHHVLGGKALVMPLGAKLEVSDIMFSTGGGATNTAVTFARQGFRTACVVSVGRDISGDAVINDLKKEKIRTDFVLKSKKPTGYSLLLEHTSGERTVLVHRGASEDLSAKNISMHRFATKWIYLSSLAGNLELLSKIVRFAGKNRIRVAYNPGGKELKQRDKLLPLLKHIDIVVANREEASLITGISFEQELKIFNVWDEMSPGINVMTDARNGVTVSDGKYLYRAGIYPEKQIVDRTGAGDAFASGFTAGIVRELAKRRRISLDELIPESVEYAICLGSANATAKVEGTGAKFGLLTRQQFERNLRWKKLHIERSKI